MTTERFFVTEHGELKKLNVPTRELKNYKYIIEIFGYNHEYHARKIKTTIESSSLVVRLIRIEI